MGRSYEDDDGGFERIRRKPKNPKKGKDNRSNQKQYIRDHFLNNPNLEDEDLDVFEDWKQK